MNTKQKTRLKTRMNFLNIPKLYSEAQTTDFGKHVAVQAETASFVTGSAGCGKTHLLYALAKKAVLGSVEEETLFVKYKENTCDTTTAICVPVLELLAEIKATFSNEMIKNEEDVVRKYCITRNLYIDDFGTHPNTDWEFAVIFRILDFRYANMLNTVMASNLTLAEISRKQSDRITSRLIGMGSGMCLQQKDRRINEN